MRLLRVLWRLFGILRRLARHGAAAPVLAALPQATLAGLGRRWEARLPAELRNQPPGRRLASALVELGPAFIKLGQFLATRPDLLGEDWAEELVTLQDRLPPFAPDKVQATIAAELGRPVEEVFLRFEEAPISAASIAQVHAAWLADGNGENGDERKVAVKVLRPGVEAAFARDLSFLDDLARLAGAWIADLRRFKLPAAVAEFAGQVEVELDLRMEAAAATELKENFADDAGYRVPAVDWRRSSQRVLTLEWVEGTRIDDREALLAAGLDLTEVLSNAARVFFEQVFRDGFFHGDQHPGNLWVDDKGRIVAVDFGIMGRLSLVQRGYLAEMLGALLARDYPALARVQFEAGFLPKSVDLPLFAQALRAVCEPIIDRPLDEISFARLLAQILRVSERFAMPVQPDLLLLQKNMVMAEGVSRRLDPRLNIWLLAQPLVEDWMRRHRGLEAQARERLGEARRLLDRVPRLLEQAEALAERQLAAQPPERPPFWPYWPLILAGAALALALAGWLRG